MPELRWILLVVGALFIIGLLAWDRARNRRSAVEPSRPGDPAAQASAPAPGPAQTLSATPATSTLASSLASARHDREIPHDLPIIQVDVDPGIDITFASVPPGRRQEPRIGTLEVDEFGAVDPVATRATPASAPVPHGIDRSGMVDGASGTDAKPVLESASTGSSAPHAGPPELRLEWPQESRRRIVAVRLVPRGADRFAGRSVRQALAGEGLRHGPMDIFHAADVSGRVIFSAANLTKPGVFDLATIDGQSFTGLNLFAVLPGPMAATETVGLLVDTARSLAARLNADLLDHRGDALTPARAAELRESVAEPAP